MIDIKRQAMGNVQMIEIEGRLDAINAPYLQNALDQVLEESAQPSIVLGMQGINYLSAAGLRVLRSLHQKLGSVTIVEPSHRVREVMQITGLDARYNLYEHQTDALHAVNPIVNAHTHLEDSWLWQGVPDVRGQDFTTWMQQAIRQPKRNPPYNKEAKQREAMQHAITTMQAAGTTEIGDVSRNGLSIQPLADAGMRGIVYIEVAGRRAEDGDAALDRAQRIIEYWKPRLNQHLSIGLSPHAPYNLHRDLWDKTLEYAERESLPLCIHVAESPAEFEYWQSGTGDLPTLYDELPPSPKQTPIQFLDQIGALALKPLLIHCVQVTDDDIQRIADAGCTVVHCPRSNLRLRVGRMPVEKFIAADIPMRLGTDSLVSVPSLNIFDELEVAVALHYERVQPDVFLEMIHSGLPETN